MITPHPTPPPTCYKDHKARWKTCTLCRLHEHRKQVVLARGKIPADVLFVGEAPGKSENVVGQPFVGPAGVLLDDLIDRAKILNPDGTPAWTHCLTNLVACMPRDEEGNKIGQPDTDEVMECRPRLEEFIGLVRPRLIVCVGAMARDWFDPKVRDRIRVPAGMPMIDILHPAYLLRVNVAQRGLLMQRVIVQIQDAVDEHLLTPTPPQEGRR